MAPNETNPAGRSARLGNMTSLGRGDNPETTKSPAPAQENNYPAPEPFPSFFQLVTENASAPMRLAATYLRVCDELKSIGDYEGYCEAGAKFLDAGREFAKLLVLLKTPTIFSNEKADRLEEKALALHELADLMEMESSGIRQVVTL
jgi:hypothetical protein